MATSSKCRCDAAKTLRFLGRRHRSGMGHSVFFFFFQGNQPPWARVRNVFPGPTALPSGDKLGVLSARALGLSHHLNATAAVSTACRRDLRASRRKYIRARSPQPMRGNAGRREADFGSGAAIRHHLETSRFSAAQSINPELQPGESDLVSQVEGQPALFPIFLFGEAAVASYMEGRGVFKTSAAHRPATATMRTRVAHRRRIVQSVSWGTKLTGTVGKTTFGLLKRRPDREPEGTSKARSRVRDRTRIFTKNPPRR